MIVRADWGVVKWSRKKKKATEVYISDMKIRKGKVLWYSSQENLDMKKSRELGGQVLCEKESQQPTCRRERKEGKPRRRWKDDMREVLGYKDLNIQDGEWHAQQRMTGSIWYMVRDHTIMS